MDKKQYFIQLKEKMLRSIEMIFGKDLQDKIMGVDNMETYVIELKEELIDKVGVDRYEQMIVKKRTTFTDTDVKMVKKYGEDNEWPMMILKRDKDNKPTKILGAGKDEWDNALTWAALKSPYKDNFLDVIDAIERYEEEKTNTS